MSLKEYKKKRHFKRTPEPEGRGAGAKGHSFVVQKHAASHLHYDFRLELDGVLKSWAVPKGPSLDPAVKRLAMQVEDHPVEYGDFEGIIPQGEYGGGTVMLWDRGSWEARGNAREGYRQGRLKFTLHGAKLNGDWMLVRTRRDDDDKSKPRWLLFKERDDESRRATDADILEEMTRSVVSQRTMDEIATDRDRVWGVKARSPIKARRVRRSEQTTPLRPAAKSSRNRSANGRSAAGARTQHRLANEYDAGKQQFAGVRLTSPDKVLYADQGITKLELAGYYRAVAPWMLPHIADRPLVLVRCPDGQEKECFYQKHPPPGTPDALRRISIREKSKREDYVSVRDVAGLISLAQVGALEIHAWGSRIDRIEQPDRLIFDLDPDPAVSWSRVVQSARQVRKFLADIGLESFVKTTGGKGLHLVVPLARRNDWEDAKAFCKLVADCIVAAAPMHYTANMSKARRVGKIFIDYLRNDRGATAICPYSTRARPGAAIAMPLTWQELTPRIRSDRYNVRSIARRLASLQRDPWEEMKSMRQSLTEPWAKLQELQAAAAPKR